MQKNGARRGLVAALALTSMWSVGHSTPAWGFAEDLCQIVLPNAPRQGKVINCFDIHCNDDLEFGSFKSAKCQFKQVVEAGLSAVDLVPIRGRSMVHFDATYVIAQALGMSAKDAYWLAAYDEAVDQGSYQAYDRAGVGIAKYTTLEIPGVRRTNFTSGGTFFHFVPPVRKDVITDHLDVQSSAEAPLNHVRLWAFGKRDTLCKFGLASEPFTNDPGCFTLSADHPAITFKFPVSSKSDGAGMVNKVLGGEVKLADELPPADIMPLVKIAIYIHTMADRLSHHECTDVSPFKRDADGHFIVDFDGGTCTQGMHAALHGLEIGHEKLPERTELAVEMTYDTLNEWLNRFPKWRKAKPLAVKRDVLVADLMNGLKPAKAADRQEAYRKVWDKYKLCGLPGDEAKGKACFPDAK